MIEKYSLFDYVKNPINKEQANKIKDFNKSNKKNEIIRFLILAMIYPFIVTYASSIMGIRESKVMNTFNHNFSYIDVLIPTIILTIFGSVFLLCLNTIMYKILKITYHKSMVPRILIAGIAFICMFYNITNYYMSYVNEELITKQMFGYILLSNMFTFEVIFGVFALTHVMLKPVKNEITIKNENNKEYFFSFDIEKNLLEVINENKVTKQIKGHPLKQMLFNSIKHQGREMYVFEYELMKNIK